MTPHSIAIMQGERNLVYLPKAEGGQILKVQFIEYAEDGGVKKEFEILVTTYAMFEAIMSSPFITGKVVDARSLQSYMLADKIKEA
jgi:hypothetical protein